LRFDILRSCIAIILAVATWGPAVGASERPNVIVILTDDQGYGDMSFNGNPVVQTPSMDSLARQSVRLTDFHVAPMCTPTRGQLLSGQDAFRNRAMNVSSGRTLLDRHLPTMASLFSEAGYRTAMFGKWHLGDNYPYRPQDRGFQESLWFPSSHLSAVPDFWSNDYFDDTFNHNGVREKFDGYCTDVFFDQATQWIAKEAPSKQPFFVYLPLNAPHGPHFVPNKYREPVRKSLDAVADKLPKLTDKQRTQLVRYLAMIANIDENLSKLLQFLNDHQLADNTIVVFLTDNGSTMGPAYYNAGMRGGKTTLWEGGHRVPCFIRWPKGNFGTPRDIDELTEVQDLLPTLLELCAITPRQTPKFDGTSLAGLLSGREQHLPDRMLVVNYSRMPTSTEGEPASIPKKDGGAVLWKKWRLLNGEQLYNVQADPAQNIDVSKQHPDVAAKMRAHLDRWWNGLGPDVAKCERAVIGNKSDNPTTLTACEWLDVFVDQQAQVRQGVPRNGVWHLDVAHAGKYEFQLRRWPTESGLALTAAIPATLVTDGKYIAGKSLPIHAARLEIAGQTLSESATASSQSIPFQVELKPGPCEMKATFLDGAGQEICGAYYVTVQAL
jgi:arylsulfatase A-like enzyme